MGIAGAPDMFQEKMSKRMRTLEHVCIYIDDLLVITMSTYDNHLDKVDAVLNLLQLAKLRVNVKKSHFALYKIEYLDTSYHVTASDFSQRRSPLSLL